MCNMLWRAQLCQDMHAGKHTYLSYLLTQTNPCARSEGRFGGLVRRFTDSGGGAAYSLGRVITDLAAYLTDNAAISKLGKFASKYNGTIVDAGDFMDEAKARMQANQQFYQATAPVLCPWLVNHA